MKQKKMNPETIVTHLGEDRLGERGAVVSPIYQNSLFTFEDWDAIDEAFNDKVNNCIYTRGQNPTVRIAEEKIAALAGGERAELLGSGMAAISAAVLHFLQAGDHVVTLNSLYGPAGSFIESYLTVKMGISVTRVSGEKVEDFQAAIQENTRLFYLESPSTAVFSLQDIRAVAGLAKSRGIHTVIDNTWATPLFQKPLEMGIDLEVHSCSKYLGGHSDIVAGVVIGREKDIIPISEVEQQLLGGKMAPFEAWLLTRSLRTLPLRMERHQESAMEVAEYLESHDRVRRVLYPGLPSFPQYELGRRQMSGYSGLLSFEIDTDDMEVVKKFVNSLRLFKIGVSWGGHESLVYAPAISYLKELPVEMFRNMGIAPGLIRFSVGLENLVDLIDDLEQALRSM